jgi:hypothetical protein
MGDNSYVQAYNIVRAATGPGNLPTISFHEAFESLGKWQTFMPGADNIALDDHPYVSAQVICSCRPNRTHSCAS